MRSTLIFLFSRSYEDFCSLRWKNEIYFFPFLRQGFLKSPRVSWILIDALNLRGFFTLDGFRLSKRPSNVLDGTLEGFIHKSEWNKFSSFLHLHFSLCVISLFLSHFGSFIFYGSFGFLISGALRSYIRPSRSNASQVWQGSTTFTTRPTSTYTIEREREKMRVR